ncbi:MAG: tRNA lysidine(34) synthetase TilS [Bacteroidetes bacterium]|nr:MAG: tRNA lysidine(34) synthetase TilS [Bacteroidota bacterium]
MAEGTQVLLAVSGGVDSMCMCHLFQHAEIPYGIAHCNFRLRGAESDADEAFVRAYAEALGVPCFTRAFDTKGYAATQGISIQMAARALRYEWFDTLLVPNGYDYVATAHHLDDQVETFFINLIRGSGIAGLHGIRPLTGKVLRPLLFATRSEILSYVEAHAIPYREDRSNASIKYLRNRIRHEVLPRMEAIEPNFSRKVNRTVSFLRKSEMIVNQCIEEAERVAVRKENDKIVINIRALWHYEPTDYYLYHFVRPYGFTASQVEDMMRALSNPPGGQFLSQSHLLFVGREEIVLVPRREVPEAYYLLEEKSEQMASSWCWKMGREAIDPSVFVFPGSESEVCLDSAKIRFPLTLRHWREGDFFFPLGMNHKKLLSDFFVDKKMDVLQKRETWLLLSGEDIIWVVGHRIDHRYRIMESTEEVIRFSVKREEISK